jgi:hypothetical protein
MGGQISPRLVVDKNGKRKYCKEVGRIRRKKKKQANGEEEQEQQQRRTWLKFIKKKNDSADVKYFYVFLFLWEF